MSLRRSPSARRAGFTLVELLIVIVIIGLLVALVSVAAIGAMTKARIARIQFEMGEMQRAITDYSNENNGLQPVSFAVYDATAPAANADSAARARTLRHLRARFPRYNVANWQAFRTAVMAASDECGYAANFLDVNNLDQAEAIVFWLGGLPGQNVEPKLWGFSTDPQNPFTPPDASNPSQAQRIRSKYQFDPARLVDRDDDGWWEFIPQAPATSGEVPPYVYFDSGSYVGCSLSYSGSPPATALPLASYPSTVSGADRGPAGQLNTWGRAWPMWRAAPTASAQAQWVNSDSFQIVWTGMDGQFSTQGQSSSSGPALFPALPSDSSGATNYVAMEDNLVNFSEKTLREARD